MLYMVIEHFKAGKKDEVYLRYEIKGRLLPRGLEYVTSWVEIDGDRCFQIMKAEHPGLLDDWVRQWDDLIDFEIVAVTDSPTKG